MVCRTPTPARRIDETFRINDAGWIIGASVTPANLNGSSHAILLIPSAPGDFDGNCTVGPEDYDLWRLNFGSTTRLAADGNNSGIVDAADFTIWRDNLGAS